MPVTEGRAGPRVAVAVVHWGGKADTLGCVQSVAGSTLPADPLLVIDNGTGMLTAAEITAVAPGAVFIAVPENLGFAGAVNLAIRHALGVGVEFVMLLNNDATLEPDCLGELVRVAASMPRIGAVGAKVLSTADPSRLWMAYGRLTYRAALVEAVGKGEPDGPVFSQIREVDSVPGCGMLLTRAALETVGLLDDEFFAYHEDLDWCTAARRRGFRIVFAPAARVVHQGGASLAANNDPVYYLAARNTVLFARKHASVREWGRLIVTVAGSLLLECVRRERRVSARQWRWLVRGYRDGLLARTVPLDRLGLRSPGQPVPAGALLEPDPVTWGKP
jgi:GT2 family glycosyltransferase